jgi:hypothetical protein
VHSSASPLDAVHSTHACGSARRSSATHAPAVRKMPRRARGIALSNFGAAKFDSMR